MVFFDRVKWGQRWGGCGRAVAGLVKQKNKKASDDSEAFVPEAGLEPAQSQ